MISTLCVLLLILWIGNYFIIHNDIIYMQYMYILYKNLTVNANIYMQVWFVKIILWDIQIQHFHTLRKEKFILKYKFQFCIAAACFIYLQNYHCSFIDLHWKLLTFVKTNAFFFTLNAIFSYLYVGRFRKFKRLFSKT